TAWLFAARSLQGLAVGMIGGAATAALVELDPANDRRRAALFAGLAQAGGSALGPVAAGMLGQWAPDPLRLPYFGGLGATALLAAISAVALLASCATQIVSQRREGSRGRDQAAGLLVLAAGMLGLVLASPLHSLALLVTGAIAAGAGHGLCYLDAQQELNELAPEERRGEVTSAFISVIYFLVASAVIGTGLLDLRFSLAVSVAAVSLVLVAAA